MTNPRTGPHPSEITIEDHGRELVITRRRTANERAAGVILPVGWTLLVGLLLSGVELSQFRWIQWLIVSPVLVSNVLVVYMGLVLLLNKETVTMSPGFLRIEDGPLPSWSRGLDIATNRIEQLELYRVERTGRNGGTFHGLRVHLDGAEPVKILTEQRERETLRFIERQIEGRLGIEDESAAR